MPRRAHLWCHCIINTLNTWLHRDERGFRSRNRDIQSSGDYKHLPPPGEYRKLNEYMEEHSGDEVHIAYALRAIVGQAILMYFRSCGYRVLAIAVAKVHAHIVVELPKDRAVVKRIIGEAKHRSSKAVTKSMPGKVWGAGGGFVICWDRSHLVNAVDYVLFYQGHGAWTWSFRDVNDNGIYGRKRPPGWRKRRGPMGRR
jgi:REP element-mobilizing transposase RayT